MKGDVWRFVRIVQPGQAQAFPQPQYAVPAPQPAAVAQPVAQPVVQPQPVALPVPAPTLAPAAPIAIPTIAPAAIDVTLKPDDTAAVRAKKLLNNRAMNEWLAVALLDDKVKGDSALINTIYDQSFIVSLKASNQIVQEADGKFSVVA